MSWIQRVQQDITITTGDGKQWQPLWMITDKTIEWNFAEFNFPQIEGSLVRRNLIKGRRFPLEIMFKGDDHIEVSNSFERSAKDTRPWRINHPMYDEILVHPQSLTFSHKTLNQTEIKGTLVETITEDPPFSRQDPRDLSEFTALEARELTSLAFDDNLELQPVEVAEITVTTNRVYELAAALTKSGEQAQEYFNQYQDTLAKISTIASEKLAGAQSIVDLFAFPSEFIDDLKRRLYIFQLQFNELLKNIADLFTPQQKKIFELQGSAIIIGMVEATTNPIETDYETMNDVTFTIETVLKTYNTFIESLDSLQTENGGEVDSYVPDFESISTLQNLVNYTISQLSNIALNSRQERSIFLAEDSNMILLSHRFYGPSEDDSNIEFFERTNNIGLNQLQEIPKGTEIFYYV